MRSIRSRRPALSAGALLGLAVLVLAPLGLAGEAASAAVPPAAVPVAASAAPSEAMLGAMTLDLGLTRAEALARIRAQDAAAASGSRLESALGASYAGAWLDAGSGALVVAATTATGRAAVRAAGATPATAARSLRTLESYQAKLGAALRTSAATAVVSSYVDVATNTLVVEATGSRATAAKRLVKAAGVPAAAVTVTTTAELPRPLINVVGGNAYYIANAARCSIGFSVTGGFVSAGHCGMVGSTTTQPTGTFAGWSFPGNDYSYVRVASGNTLIGGVNNYSGGTVAVTGSTPAVVGATVCRSGSTTGWHCGTVQAYNATVYYGGYGYVYGLIRTNVCAEPGDSGGSLLAGTQAQGVTSGGSGNCRRGGTTYFQPVNEILSAYGVSLIM